LALSLSARRSILMDTHSSTNPILGPYSFYSFCPTLFIPLSPVTIITNFGIGLTLFSDPPTPLLTHFTPHSTLKGGDSQACARVLASTSQLLCARDALSSDERAGITESAGEDARSRTSLQIPSTYPNLNTSLILTTPLDRLLQIPDVSHLVEICKTKEYRGHFPELKTMYSELWHIKDIRNHWAHSQAISDCQLIAFLSNCEDVVAAICTEATYPSYEQIKLLRQCWLLSTAERVYQELSHVDETGQQVITYPRLLPPFDD